MAAERTLSIHKAHTLSGFVSHVRKWKGVHTRVHSGCLDDNTHCCKRLQSLFISSQSLTAASAAVRKPRASAATVLRRFASLACCIALWHVCCSAMPAYRLIQQNSVCNKQAHTATPLSGTDLPAHYSAVFLQPLCALYNTQCSVYPVIHS